MKSGIRSESPPDWQWKPYQFPENLANSPHRSRICKSNYRYNTMEIKFPILDPFTYKIAICDSVKFSVSSYWIYDKTILIGYYTCGMAPWTDDAVVIVARPHLVFIRRFFYRVDRQTSKQLTCWKAVTYGTSNVLQMHCRLSRWECLEGKGRKGAEEAEKGRDSWKSTGDELGCHLTHPGKRESIKSLLYARGAGSSRYTQQKRVRSTTTITLRRPFGRERMDFHPFSLSLRRGCKGGQRWRGREIYECSWDPRNLRPRWNIVGVVSRSKSELTHPWLREGY